MYTAFATVYDRLMADVDYPAWAAFYRELLSLRGVKGGAVCECACGTGGLTLPLSRTFEMTGVDASADMLAVAAGKARRAGTVIPFVQMDMRSFTLHRPQDAILCTCDGVNYLPSAQDTAAFFRATYKALKPGGALIFDVSTPWKLKNVLGNHTHGEEADDIAYLWTNHFHAQSCSVEMRLSIFQRGQDGRYSRIVEEQIQYGYTLAQLTQLLEAEGFTAVQAFGDRVLDTPKPQEKRWHIAATKKEL